MPFKVKEAEELLVHSHRRCCICHRFCGVKIELDHIDPIGEGGTDDIENAIPVCFECHAEIHCYNDSQPRGRKFRPGELRAHKEQWLTLLKERPGVLLEPAREIRVGPMQGLVDELEFNLGVARRDRRAEVGCPFLDDQFRRALEEGIVSLLRQSLQEKLNEAYRLMMRANTAIRATTSRDPISETGHSAVLFISESAPKISEAREELLSLVLSDSRGQVGTAKRK